MDDMWCDLCGEKIKAITIRNPFYPHDGGKYKIDVCNHCESLTPNEEEE